MKTPTLLLFAPILMLFPGSARAGDATLSIEPDPYVSSDAVTICRVVARNDTRHTLDGRKIAFEARAWENGVLVASERGRFKGAVPAGHTAETRIGFNGVFYSLTVEPIEAGALGRRGGGKRGGKASKRSKGRSKSPAKSSKAKARRPRRRSPAA